MESDVSQCSLKIIHLCSQRPHLSNRGSVCVVRYCFRFERLQISLAMLTELAKASLILLEIRKLDAKGES